MVANARLMKINSPTKGIMIIEIRSEIHGKVFFTPRAFKSLMPYVDPTTYTSMAAPLGINRSLSRSTFRK